MLLAVRRLHTVTICYHQNDHDFAPDLPAGPEDPRYWERCSTVIHMAQELGIVMALLPCWGSAVDSGRINSENWKRYLNPLERRCREFSNIIWILGGDVRGSVAPELYRRAGNFLKGRDPERLIGYHPFGRISSSRWFHTEPWLDFNMFQSGHQRYDQVSLGAGDRNADEPQYSGDNWKYVLEDFALRPAKPTIDGEPSYEDIPQGLSDGMFVYGSKKSFEWGFTDSDAPYVTTLSERT